MYKQFFILCAFVLLINCHSRKKKVEPTASSCEQYVAGDLLVGAKETTTLQTAFDLANQCEFHIRQVSLEYTSDLPADSISFLVDILNKKSYIKRNGWSMSASVISGKVVLFPTLFNMDKTNQNDWQESVLLFGLTELPATKAMYLRVPEGKEKFYALIWSQNPIIKWAELNCIVTRQPFGKEQ